MSIFNQKSKFKVKTEIRTVRTVVAAQPRRLKPTSSPAPTPGARRKTGSGASSSSTPRGSPRPSPAAHAPSSSSKHLTSAAAEGNKRKRRAGSRLSAASPSFSESEGSDDEGWEESLDARKRLKRAREAQQHTDPNRVLRHPKMWTGESETDPESLKMWDAVEFASLEQKCQPVMGLTRDEVDVKLQYPGARYPERYVWMKAVLLIELRLTSFFHP